MGDPAYARNISSSPLDDHSEARNMNLQQPARTTAVTPRSNSRVARLRLRHPGRRRSWFAPMGARYPVQAEHPCYDPDLSMELLARTCELPASKRDLVVLLTEYRHALYAVATKAASSRP